MISGQWRMTRYCTRMFSMTYQPVNENIMRQRLFQRGPLSDCWCMWEANKWWRLVEVGEITEENPVMLPLSNPRPLHVHQPVFFMSSKTMHIFMQRSSTHILLSKSVVGYFKFKKLNWGTTCTWVPWGRAAHHNAPEKILIHPLCVSLLTPDGFFVISTGFLEVPVGICSTHIG